MKKPNKLTQYQKYLRKQRRLVAKRNQQKRIRRIKRKQYSRDARNLPKRLRALGLSISQIADKTGIDPSQIERIIEGQRKLQLATFVNLARGLGVSTEELL